MNWSETEGMFTESLITSKVLQGKQSGNGTQHFFFLSKYNFYVLMSFFFKVRELFSRSCVILLVLLCCVIEFETEYFHRVHKSATFGSCATVILSLFFCLGGNS